MEWLEPSIEKRCWEVLSICENENKELYRGFSSKLINIKAQIPGTLTEELNELEDLFIQRMLVVMSAYRMGFNEGLGIKKEIE